MRLRAALVGDLTKVMDKAVKDMESAAVKASRQAADSMRDDLRAQTASAGLPKSLQKAWQRKVYLNKGLDAAGFVFSKSQDIHAAFATGGEIRAKNGSYLVIPLKGAVRAGLHTSMRKSRGSRPRKWSELEPALRRFGNLRRIALSKGRYLLVAPGYGKSGKALKPGARRRKGYWGLPLFLLVPRVRLGKRIDFEGAKRRAQKRHPKFLEQALSEELGR